LFSIVFFIFVHLVNAVYLSSFLQFRTYSDVWNRFRNKFASLTDVLPVNLLVFDISPAFFNRFSPSFTLHFILVDFI